MRTCSVKRPRLCIVLIYNRLCVEALSPLPFNERSVCFASCKTLGVQLRASMPALEKGEVARLVKVSLLSIQSSENLSLISLKQIRAVTVGIVFP